MAMDAPRPELVVAIDFGMTCTGVAFYNIATGEETVRWIQKWPGKAGAVENKVPTVLVYPKNSTVPSSWGFLAESPTEQMSDAKDCKEWFKTWLDDEKFLQVQKASQNQPLFPESMQEVERLYCDFFRLLYQTIQQRLEGELANRWEDACIEFIFSVPTTWKPVPTVERFRSITQRAGFGRHPNHRPSIGLTEAEAAAVHTSRTFPKIFKEHDVMIVCDVGGGTTDLSVLRVTNTSSTGSISLQQMDVVQGATIGSVQLDRGFEESAYQRLILADRHIPTGLSADEIEEVAWQMVKSKEYQNAKCDYGSSSDDTEFFTVAVPKLDRRYTNEVANIAHGEMRIRRDDIQGYFDAQISKLFELIDNQLNRLQQMFPQEQVAHLVLSGGLGNSPYVQRRLRDRYSYGNAPFPNARALQVRVAPEPQLVVCKGIVYDRVQKLKMGRSVLGWRCSRASYGTLCRILYNPQNPEHRGKNFHVDPMDKKLYLLNCISWFIKQGEPVSIDQPIVKEFTNRCAVVTSSKPNPNRTFPTSVITSDVERGSLPTIIDSTCRKLCDITTDFSSLPLALFKIKNRHWWNSGPKYHRIDYLIKVVLGPADIWFELWHNGQKLSKDELIKVDWDIAQAPVRDIPCEIANVGIENVKLSSPTM